MYSQTWAYDHLSTTTTILRPRLKLLSQKWPLSNDHLSSTATIFGSRGWSLCTGLIAFKSLLRLIYCLALTIQILSECFGSSSWSDFQRWQNTWTSRSLTKKQWIFLLKLLSKLFPIKSWMEIRKNVSKK